jgi:predicted nucleic acid-binding protein
MNVYYLEASAWVKRYLSEPGSTWVQKFFTQKEPLACCTLGYTEVSAAISR